MKDACSEAASERQSSGTTRLVSLLLDRNTIQVAAVPTQDMAAGANDVQSILKHLVRAEGVVLAGFFQSARTLGGSLRRAAALEWADWRPPNCPGLRQEL